MCSNAFSYFLNTCTLGKCIEKAGFGDETVKPPTCTYSMAAKPFTHVLS